MGNIPTDTSQGTPLSALGKLRSRLERGMRQPHTEQPRKPSLLSHSSDSKQTPLEEISSAVSKLVITPNRPRSHSTTADSTICDSPDIDTVSNFSSPGRSIGSMDSLRLQRSGELSPSSRYPQHGDSTSRPSLNFSTPVPKISITSDDGSPLTLPQLSPRSQEPSKFTRLRNRTRSLFFDQYAENPFKGISLARARSSSIGDKRNLQGLTRTSSDNEQEDIHTPSTTDSTNLPENKQEKEFMRKRSRTFGSMEGDLYHKRNGSIVKALGNMVMLKQRPNQDVITPTLSASDGSSEMGMTPKQLKHPEIAPDDSPEEYLTKIINYGFEPEAPSIFSSDDSEFLRRCLKSYMDQKFDFTDEPLDISLRRFLLECELPKETQQIDRVLDSFSERFYSCNTQYWDNKDQIYFLTFSLVMLHTDHFNTNNRKKMTKEQFVKNTRVEDQDKKICNSFLPREFLEYFYDNITSTKFIPKNELHQAQQQPIYLLPKRIFSSNSSTNLEAMPTIRHSTTRSHSISSTTSQFFNNLNIADPYFYILTEQISSLRLGLEPISAENPFESRLTHTFPHSFMTTIRDSLTNENGKFIRFPKECNWVPTRTELLLRSTEEDLNHKNHCVLRVVKHAELYREETLTNKFFTIGSNPKVIWKKCYGMLTTCGLFIFDNLSFMTSEQREQLLNKEPLEEPLIIDILSESALKSCTKLSITGLFACQSSQAEAGLHNQQPNHYLFNIFSTNRKEIFSASSHDDMSLWIMAINYIASLDSCHMDYPIRFNHEMIPIRSMSVSDKINKLLVNLPLSKKKIDELMRLQKHFRVVTPLSTKTREELLAHHQALDIRMDWLWYEVERNKAFTSLLRSELMYLQPDDRYSLKATDEDSFLEGSFINDDSANNDNEKGERSKLNIVTSRETFEGFANEDGVNDNACVLVNDDGTTEEVDDHDDTGASEELTDLIHKSTVRYDTEKSDRDVPDMKRLSGVVIDGGSIKTTTTTTSDGEDDLFVDALDAYTHGT